MQRDLEEFEAQIAEYTGAAHAVGVANATDGLQLALLAGGIASGDEVIICSHTMIATAAAVHFAGGVPVPVETGPDHLIDLESVEAAITQKTRAILPAQLNGRTANMDRLIDIAHRHDLDIYEDAAQALGSKYRGRCAGTFGVASSISFYPAKTLGCFGDGGVVLTNDDDVWARLMLLRDHGKGDDAVVKLRGVNSRLDNLQAAILNSSWSHTMLASRGGVSWHRPISDSWLGAPSLFYLPVRMLTTNTLMSTRTMRSKRKTGTA